MRRTILRFLDKAVGPSIILLLLAGARLSRLVRRGRPGAPAEPRRFLAIKMVGLGDTVLMLTPLQALRRRFPQATLSVLTTPLSSGILATQGMDEVIIYQALSAARGPLGFGGLVRRLRSLRFDCVIDFEQHFLLSAVLAFLTGAPRRIGFCFQGGLRRLMFTDPVEIDPDRHMVDSFMSLLGPLGIDAPQVETLEVVRTGPEMEAKVAAWLERHGVGARDLLVGVHPGTGPRAPSRRWEPGNFADIIRRLRASYGTKVVITGTAAETLLADQIVSLAGAQGVWSSAGAFSPGEIAALAKRCSLFVSNDTGVMHIAAAAGTPTVGLFGPQSPRRYSPVGPRNAFLYKPLPCSPCVEIHRGESRSCDEGHCIREISADDVWAKIVGLNIGGTGG